MRITTHKFGFVAVLALAGILGFGSMTALAGGDVGELLKDKEYRKEFEAEKKQQLKEWKSELGKKVKNKEAEWGATEVGTDATVIVKTELIPVTDADFDDMDEATAEELKKLGKGQYNLRVYLDNGEIHEVGPFKKEPRRVELVDTSAGGIAGKALLIED